MPPHALVPARPQAQRSRQRQHVVALGAAQSVGEACEDVGAGPWKLDEFSWFGRARNLGSSIYLNTATINGRLNLTLHGSNASRATLQDLGERLGAEIEQVIVSALYAAHATQAGLDTHALMQAIRETRPLSVLMAEQVQALREWALPRTVPAD